MAAAVVTARPHEALKAEEAPDLYSQLKSLQRQLEFLEIQVSGSCECSAASRTVAGRGEQSSSMGGRWQVGLVEQMALVPACLSSSSVARYALTRRSTSRRSSAT